MCGGFNFVWEFGFYTWLPLSASFDKYGLSAECLRFIIKND